MDSPLGVCLQLPINNIKVPTPQPSGPMFVGLNDPATLKSEIFTQLGDEVFSWNIGFQHGMYLIRNEKKWIHNAEDARDAIAIVTGGAKLTLWCTGTDTKAKK